MKQTNTESLEKHATTVQPHVLWSAGHGQKNTTGSVCAISCSVPEHNGDSSG